MSRFLICVSLAACMIFAEGRRTCSACNVATMSSFRTFNFVQQGYVAPQSYAVQAQGCACEQQVQAQYQAAAAPVLLQSVVYPVAFTTFSTPFVVEQNFIIKEQRQRRFFNRGNRGANGRGVNVAVGRH